MLTNYDKYFEDIQSKQFYFEQIKTSTYPYLCCLIDDSDESFAIESCK